MKLEHVETIYEGWGNFLMAVVRSDDGKQLRREVEDHGDAAMVLPYDAERRVAMLVRQHRPATLVHGFDSLILEAPAGRIEVGDAAETARREAMEECGLRLGDLDCLGTFWGMPGISTERVTLFLAPYSAADRVEAGGGLEEEGEAIEPVEIGFDALFADDMAGVCELRTALLIMALRRKLGQ